MRRTLRTGNRSACVSIVPRDFRSLLRKLERAILESSVVRSVFPDFQSELSRVTHFTMDCMVKGKEESGDESVIAWN